MNHIFVAENLRCSKDSAFDRGRDTLELQTPTLNRLLVLEGVKHLLDAVHALHGRQLGFHKGIAHAWSLSDAIRDAIDDGELGWQVEEVVSHLDHKERLIEVSHVQLVLLGEVLSNCDFLAIVGELKVGD